jgi:Protein of unknown function (DUF2996)
MVEESAENVVPPTKAGGEIPKSAAAAAVEPSGTSQIGEVPATEGKVPPKKEKPPAVEAKPFTEFIQQDYLPALTKALTDQGVSDLQLNLERSKIAIKGFENSPECSQVIGRWNGGNRQFNVYFFDDNIQGQRAISCVDFGHRASTLEAFVIDERKVTLDLLVAGVVLRLNSQKWLTRN